MPSNATELIFDPSERGESSGAAADVDPAPAFVPTRSGFVELPAELHEHAASWLDEPGRVDFAVACSRSLGASRDLVLASLSWLHLNDFEGLLPETHEAAALMRGAMGRAADYGHRYGMHEAEAETRMWCGAYLFAAQLQRDIQRQVTPQQGPNLPLDDDANHVRGPMRTAVANMRAWLARESGAAPGGSMVWQFSRSLARNTADLAAGAAFALTPAGWGCATAALASGLSCCVRKAIPSRHAPMVVDPKPRAQLKAAFQHAPMIAVAGAAVALGPGAIPFYTYAAAAFAAAVGSTAAGGRHAPVQSNPADWTQKHFDQALGLLVGPDSSGTTSGKHRPADAGLGPARWLSSTLVASGFSIAATAEGSAAAVLGWATHSLVGATAVLKWAADAYCIASGAPAGSHPPPQPPAWIDVGHATQRIQSDGTRAQANSAHDQPPAELAVLDIVAWLRAKQYHPEAPRPVDPGRRSSWRDRVALWESLRHMPRDQAAVPMPEAQANVSAMHEANDQAQTAAPAPSAGDLRGVGYVMLDIPDSQSSSGELLSCPPYPPPPSPVGSSGLGAGMAM